MAERLPGHVPLNWSPSLPSKEILKHALNLVCSDTCILLLFVVPGFDIFGFYFFHAGMFVGNAKL